MINSVLRIIFPISVCFSLVPLSLLSMNDDHENHNFKGIKRDKPHAQIEDSVQRTLPNVTRQKQMGSKKKNAEPLSLPTVRNNPHIQLEDTAQRTTVNTTGRKKRINKNKKIGASSLAGVKNNTHAQKDGAIQKKTVSTTAQNQIGNKKKEYGTSLTPAVKKVKNNPHIQLEDTAQRTTVNTTGRKKRINKNKKIEASSLAGVKNNTHAQIEEGIKLETITTATRQRQVGKKKESSKEVSVKQGSIEVPIEYGTVPIEGKCLGIYTVWMPIDELNRELKERTQIARKTGEQLGIVDASSMPVQELTSKIKEQRRKEKQEKLSQIARRMGEELGIVDANSMPVQELSNKIEEHKRKEEQLKVQHTINREYPRVAPQQRCRYFNGKPDSCRYGNNCKFSHSDFSQQKKKEKSERLKKETSEEYRERHEKHEKIYRKEGQRLGIFGASWLPIYVLNEEMSRKEGELLGICWDIDSIPIDELNEKIETTIREEAYKLWGNADYRSINEIKRHMRDLGKRLEILDADQLPINKLCRAIESQQRWDDLRRRSELRQKLEEKREKRQEREEMRYQSRKEENEAQERRNEYEEKTRKHAVSLGIYGSSNPIWKVERLIKQKENPHYVWGLDSWVPSSTKQHTFPRTQKIFSGAETFPGAQGGSDERDNLIARLEGF